MPSLVRPRKAPRFPPPPLPDDPASLAREALASARRHGFAAAGIIRADRPKTAEIYRRWLASGYHGEMGWLERDAEPRESFDSILPYTRSILAVARAVPGHGSGNVARYARGEDYHRVVRRALHAVAQDLAPLAPAGSHFRACVDTAPLLEREVAARAGLGFIGKNGLLIVPGLGSHVVLGELLTDVVLAPTAPPIDAAADRCGACTACLEGCPTSAFVAPRVVDSRRCLSYLTIEKRGAFSEEEAASLDGRLFGCDVCQDVCPFNQAVELSGAADGGANLVPEEIAALDDAGFASRFGHSAISRATAEGLRRNARAALALPGAAR
ncbi:MAG TPA: tRNA epoxyqueuosine(34) reductase QueG [Thermoanaerobaculia bacterium]|nr:tRNA epoxyqueuosine(34) reductase QueG [Thermoanaerobaculia bacterium]